MRSMVARVERRGEPRRGDNGAMVRAMGEGVVVGVMMGGGVLVVVGGVTMSGEGEWAESRTVGTMEKDDGGITSSRLFSIQESWAMT